MKPIKLKMKAFGSYANETVIDFNKLDSGLYLITGDTGAGKTTIFDAMVFALYGEGSGSGRKWDMLHSDFAPKSEDTVVEFEFNHNGRTYTVERKIHFRNSRNGGYGDPDHKATLKEENGQPIQGAEKVKARITEIIGLDVNQFKQIIVLAQGEFQKFLSANSEDRSKILGKLFDSSPYIRFENRLLAASKNLKSKIADEEKEIAMKMSDFKIPEGEDSLKYDIANPDCVDNIGVLVEKEKKDYKELDDKFKKLDKEDKDITAEQAKAEERNRELDALKKLDEEYNVLLKQKDENNTLAQKLQVVEKANNQVAPLKKAYSEAKQNFNDNETKLKETTQQLEIAKASRDNAIKEFAKNEELNKQKTELSTELNELKKQLENFEPYNKCKKEVEDATKQNEKLKNEVSALENEKETLETRKKEIQEKIDSKKSDAEKLAERKVEADNANKRYDQLVGKDGLNDKIKNINLEVVSLGELKKDELKLNEQLRNKKGVFDHLYDSFIKSQASILAKELELELEDKEEVECPVCHSHILKKDASKLSINENEIITKEQVIEAEKEFKSVETSMNKKHSEADVKIAEIEGLKKNALESAKQLDLDVSSYDELTDDYISTASESFLKQKTVTLNLFETSKTAKEELDTQGKTLKDIEEKQNKNITSLDAKKKFLNENEISLASLKTNLKNLEKSLQGHTENEIKDKITKNEDSIKAINNEVNRLTKNKEDTEKKFSTINGSLKTLKENKERFEKERDEKLAQFHSSLQDNGFENEQAYKDTIAIAEPDVLIWINNTRKTIQDYIANLRSKGDQLNSQKNKCKDYVRADLEAIKTNLSKIENEKEQISNQRDVVNNLLSGHRSTLEFVQEKNKEIAKYKPASYRLEQLSNLANAGVNNEGGRISFDRYVMGSAFAEILRAANVHLSVMASGQFELIHQTKGEGANLHAGLGIEVLDVFTGERRKPDSLSGGEKFQVSMALALGLSDVVQNHAGGKKIDTMYIDEGFGTLDEAVLGKAIEVLKNIAGDSRQIGIISHVDRLEESIPQKIVVRKSDKGSSLEIIK